MLLQAVANFILLVWSFAHFNGSEEVQSWFWDMYDREWYINIVAVVIGVV